MKGSLFVIVCRFVHLLLRFYYIFYSTVTCITVSYKACTFNNKISRNMNICFWSSFFKAGMIYLSFLIETWHVLYLDNEGKLLTYSTWNQLLIIVVFVADFSVESKQCFLLLQFLINKMRDKLYFSSISWCLMLALMHITYFCRYFKEYIELRISLSLSHRNCKYVNTTCSIYF